MFSEILREEIERGLRGENVSVALTSNPYSGDVTKIGKILPAGRGIYMAVVGEESSGKTAFADEFTVLNPILHAMKHGTTPPYVLYRSFERPRAYKLAKWLSYIIFYQSKGQLEYSTELILSWANRKRDLHEGDLNVLNEHLHLLDEIEKCIELIPGLASPEEVQLHAASVAHQLGKVVEGKDGKVVVNGEVVAMFSDDLYEDRDGIKRRYYDGRLGRLYENDKVYFPSSDRLVVHVVDHISRYAEDKGVIDTHTKWASGTARDLYKWWVVDLNQLNRTNITNERGVYALQNVKNSGTLTADADVVVTVVDPAHLRVPQWAGYDIGETVRDGEHLFRGVQILKNSYGLRPMLGFYFTGAVGHYSELPKAEDMTDNEYRTFSLKNRRVF